MVLDQGEINSRRKHFVLVHGVCAGGWCWFKLVALLRSEGHRVTAIDMAASGSRRESISDVRNFRDYSKPLMDLLESDLHEGETVILVGHSLGGLNLPFAMESFPEKISAAVFVTGLMPDCSAPPSSVLNQLFATTPPDLFLDTRFTREDNKTVMILGPKCLRLLVGQNCYAEDTTLNEMLVRPGSLFLEDLSASPKLSEEKYGSVRRVFIVCKDDKLLTEEFQRWMIQKNPPEEVMEIEGSDHMPMLCKPKKLLHHLLKIAGSG
ncbi:hypothetical protein H6P81_020917 [Aristolochia fimbriata]|uniref:AB hydrolase-1 domain-containing protein n=1 Tax=Aristolochia fimbriata TaxID=158543 RepID=A0AAV7DVR8_ARIFI|nr:hypothetical protein H6P81_020917 [Aristolochia fimbriata]